MRCKSCQGEVPPKFAYAIQMNVCPLCGGQIMDEELQCALQALKVAMDATDAYKIELFDWLRSNYNLYTEEDVQARIIEATKDMAKKNTVKSVNRTLPADEKDIVLDENGNQISGPTIQSPEQTSKFITRAGISKSVDRNQHFKDIIKKIKGEDNSNGEPSGEGGASVITPELANALGVDPEDIDPVELEELQAVFDDGSNLRSGLDNDNDLDEEIPSVVLNMAGLGGKGDKSKDLQKLAAMQNKSASRSRAMAKGGGVGLIRR